MGGWRPNRKERAESKGFIKCLNWAGNDDFLMSVSTPALLSQLPG